jgi:hypothetical protein
MSPCFERTYRNRKTVAEGLIQLSAREGFDRDHMLRAAAKFRGNSVSQFFDGYRGALRLVASR